MKLTGWDDSGYWSSRLGWYTITLLGVTQRDVFYIT